MSVMRPSKATIAVARRYLSSTRESATPACIDAREWAKKRPELARDALVVPPAPPLHEGLEGNAPAPPLASLESYLKWRGWDMPKTISPEDDALAISLVSHPLTFPLTLAKNMPILLSTWNERNYDEHSPRTPKSNSSATARLCCIGARAEAALPDEYWREALLYYSSILSLNTKGTSACTISIDFIGPDISPHLQPKTVVLDTGMSWPMIRLKMDFHRQYLHQYISDRYKEEAKDKDPASLLSLWDCFLLFNPGIGHPNLARCWLPTLRYVLKSKRPVLLTAHSHLDCARDWSVLKATMLDLGQEERVREINATYRRSTGSDEEEKKNPYKSNPFASRVEFEDPFCDDDDEKNKIAPNMFSLLLPARQR